LEVPKVSYDIGDIDTPAICLNNYDETNVIRVEGFTNDENNTISPVKIFGINYIFTIYLFTIIISF
jgi:hypothetical protein